VVGPTPPVTARAAKFVAEGALCAPRRDGSFALEETLVVQRWGLLITRANPLEGGAVSVLLARSLAGRSRRSHERWARRVAEAELAVVGAAPARKPATKTAGIEAPWGAKQLTDSL
jgi:hypothetical protein